MFMPRQKEPSIIMDEIPRTYYPGRGFLTDQEAYPTDLYGNIPPPNLKYDPTRDGTPQIIPLPYPVPMPGNQGNNQGGFNVGRALGSIAGSLGMGFGNPAFTPGPILSGRYSDLMATNYTQPPFSTDTQQDIDRYNQMQMNPAGASFNPEQLNVQPKIQPGDPDYNPFRLEQDRDRFILNDPRSGVAQMPRRIQGNYRSKGVFGSPPPNLDSPYMDEKIRRGFVPMTPPVRRPGPQLPGFV